MGARVDFGFDAKPIAEFEAEVAPRLGPVVRSVFRGRFSHEFMDAKPKREWLLRNVFLKRTLNLFVGEPGSGKSFLALDYALHLALAVVDPTAPTEWFGRKITPCGVVYVAAEGQDDFIVRMHAFLHARGLPATTRIPFYLYPTAIDLRSSLDIAKRVTDEIKDVTAVMRAQFGCSVGATFVDTLNKALAGGDDTKAEHIGSLYRHCDYIKTNADTAVFALHHTAKNSKTKDPRGHGSVRGDNDAEIFITAANGVVPNSWTVERAKGAPRGDRHEFRLRRVVVGREEDGEEITSCIVAPGAMEASSEEHAMRDAEEAIRTGKPNMTADGRFFLPTNSLTVMKALQKLIDAETKNADRALPPPDVRVPHGRVAVSQETWFEEIVRAMPGYVEPKAGNEKDVAKHRDRCRKMRDTGSLKLTERGFVGMDRGWIWRTNKRVASLDRPAVEETQRYDPNAADMSEEDIDKLFQ